MRTILTLRCDLSHVGNELKYSVYVQQHKDKKSFNEHIYFHNQDILDQQQPSHCQTTI